MSDRTRVAIACQGGGSHTAFTAGVLKRVLSAEGGHDYEITGFSGTSGGAICALLAWYGKATGGDEKAIDLLDSFWEANSATSAVESGFNELAHQMTTMESMGFPLPELSPYNTPMSWWVQKKLKDILREHVDFGEVRSIDTRLDLLISAVNVKTGEFEIFEPGEITAKSILASAAEPQLFRAVEINGESYWDGMFSKNPPVRDFVLDGDTTDPDEIWVVQVNPQKRHEVPTSLHGIVDRRNELAGNLSMQSEIDFVEHINDWVSDGRLSELYTPTQVRKIVNQRDLHWSTKLDRSPGFIDEMMEYGDEEARKFLDNL
ncbi:MAG: patatin-like phospholipase family protein [Halobacteria archaeon]|nr:patatin-like phospholipase family protein [Halobacteria archaeon]